MALNDKSIGSKGYVWKDLSYPFMMEVIFYFFC
jgi:hypothetical protein